MITVGIADDTQLFLKSVTLLINSFPGFRMIVDGANGKELMDKLSGIGQFPDILLIDVEMPEMNGMETTIRIMEMEPLAKVIALSIRDDDQSIINMIRAGCCSYLMKDMAPDELENAMKEVYDTGIYNGDLVNINHRRLLKKAIEKGVQISVREKEFLQFASSDLTYRQIADKMHLSERTIDGYREALFEKLNVQSRVGMILEAIRKQLVSLHH